jgi:hypothetical protein
VGRGGRGAELRQVRASEAKCGAASARTQNGKGGDRPSHMRAYMAA